MHRPNNLRFPLSPCRTQCGGTDEFHLVRVERPLFFSRRRLLRRRLTAICLTVLCSATFSVAVALWLPDVLAAEVVTERTHWSDARIYTTDGPLGRVTLHAPRGPVYQASEEDWLSTVQKKAQEVLLSGEWLERIVATRENMRTFAQEPVGVDLPLSREMETSFTAIDLPIPNDHPAHDALEGFRRRFLFFDARDERAVRWAQTRLRDDDTARVVLLAGNVPETSRVLGRAVRFDTYGRLAHRLGLTRQPALVTLEKKGFTVLYPDLSEEIGEEKFGNAPNNRTSGQTAP